MKHLLLFFAFALLITTAFAQDKKSDKKKPEVKKEYHKFIAVEIGDFQNLHSAVEQWRKLIPYDKSLSAEDRVATIENLDVFLAPKTGFITRVRLDSTVIVPPDTVKHK